MEGVLCLIYLGCLKKLILYSPGNNIATIYFLLLFLKRNRLSFNQLFAQKRANLYQVIQVLWKRLPRSEARKSYNINERSHKDCSLVTFPSCLDDIHEILQFPACMRTQLQHVRKSQRRLPSRYSPASTQHLFFRIASVA